MPTRQEKVPLTKLTVTDQVQIKITDPEGSDKPTVIRARITEVHFGAVVSVSPIGDVPSATPIRGRKKKVEVSPLSEVPHYSVAGPDAPATWFALFETGETVMQTDNDPEILCVNHDKHNNFRK